MALTEIIIDDVGNKIRFDGKFCMHCQFQTTEKAKIPTFFCTKTKKRLEFVTSPARPVRNHDCYKLAEQKGVINSRTCEKT